MRKSNHHNIRAILNEHPDGLTVAQLMFQIGLIAKDVNENSIRNALPLMPDTYIDRWIETTKNRYSAVWCAVQVPENCPHPTLKQR